MIYKYCESVPETLRDAEINGAHYTLESLGTVPEVLNRLSERIKEARIAGKGLDYGNVYSDQEGILLFNSYDLYDMMKEEKEGC